MFLFAVLLLVTFTGCKQEPVPIRLDFDTCSYCEMKISDARFPAELITEKGKMFTFDAVECLIHSLEEGQHTEAGNRMYVADYTGQPEWIPVESASFVVGGLVRSPMNGNAAAFKNGFDAKKANAGLKGTIMSWTELKRKAASGKE